MALPLYLAMTAAEFYNCPVLPPKTAWMACHFSPYGTGLSNCPQTLPPDSMLIVNDRTPIAGHDPKLIVQQLTQMLEELPITSVLLDFQRPDTPELFQLSQVLTTALSCPVGVAHHYADNCDSPVFLPPVPLNIPLEQYLQPWSGRELWLEVALGDLCITVSQTGTTFHNQCASSENPTHREELLHCRYQIETGTDTVRFLLHRTQKDIDALLAEATSLGVTKAIGLYQELGEQTAKTTKSP